MLTSRETRIKSAFRHCHWPNQETRLFRASQNWRRRLLSQWHGKRSVENSHPIETDTIQLNFFLITMVVSTLYTQKKLLALDIINTFYIIDSLIKKCHRSHCKYKFRLFYNIVTVLKFKVWLFQKHAPFRGPFHIAERKVKSSTRQNSIQLSIPFKKLTLFRFWVSFLNGNA